MASRADHIVREAARLFAERGYGATSIDEIGMAAGVSGPAVYWHFNNKQAVLAAILVDISERLLDSGRRCVADAADDADALRRLIDQQVAFALDEPDLIVVHSRELHHLDSADADRRRCSGHDRTDQLDSASQPCQPLRPGPHAQKNGPASTLGNLRHRAEARFAAAVSMTVTRERRVLQ